MTILAVQTALFRRMIEYGPLTALLAKDARFPGSPAIYDHVPQEADSGNDAAFPYVVIGADRFSEWDTDDSQGFEVKVTIHAWSRQKGRAEIKRIQQEIYNALHRFELEVEGAKVVTLQQGFAESFVEPDGITRHGVQEYHLILDNV